MLRKMTVAVAIAGIALALSACGEAGDAPPAGTDGSQPEAAATVSTDPLAALPQAGPVVPEGGRPAPDWFPVADVYRPADYVVAEVNEVVGDRMIELQTSGDPGGLAGQARAGMLAAGWTENHFTGPEGVGGPTMHYLKGTRSVTIAMTRADAGVVRVLYNFATIGPGRGE